MISVVEKNSFITFNQVKDTRLKVYTKVQTTGYTHHQGGQIGLYQKTSKRAGTFFKICTRMREGAKKAHDVKHTTSPTSPVFISYVKLPK